ncbi:hypothetical protein ACLOJK_001888 [Asimina triloba]
MACLTSISVGSAQSISLSSSETFSSTNSPKVHGIFRAEDPESALEAAADGTLKGCCPIDEVYKMAEISAWCLNDEAVNRPEMREIVVLLSQIVTASVAWEASLGGKSQVFSGILNGR